MRGGVRGGPRGGLRGGLPEWALDTPEAQFKSEVKGSLRGPRVTLSLYKIEDFRRSGTGQGGVREGSGRCVHLGEALVAFFGAYRSGNENLVRTTLCAA